MCGCVCVSNDDSRLFALLIILLLFSTFGPFDYLFTSLPAKVLAPQNLFSICHFTTNPTFVWCARILWFAISTARVHFALDVHCIVFVCEFVNYLTENSFQFSLPYAVDVWSWARHRTHHTKHIPCTTVHCDHWPSSSPNKCRIIVVVSLLCGWGWGGSSMSLDCKFINAFSFTMHARSATTSQRWNIFMPFAQYFGVLQMKCQRNCQTFEMQTIE